MSRTFVYLLFAAGLAVLAFPIDSTRASYQDSDFSAMLEDAWGNTLPTYDYQGRTFVLGEYGRRYNIRVYNNTGYRIEAVVSVDGRDVISGKVGDYTSERGYVLKPFSSVLIEGFRQSYSKVAAFRFTDPSNSYSSRMGTPQNVGVVGVSIFPEKRSYYRRYPRPLQTPVPEPWSGGAPGSRGEARGADKTRPEEAPAARSESEAYAGGSYGGLRDQSEARGISRQKNNLGTEYAEGHYSPVQEVTFQRQDRLRPARLLALYYDDREGLRARGIPVEPPIIRDPEPEPFPNNRFAPPPP